MWLWILSVLLLALVWTGWFVILSDLPLWVPISITVAIAAGLIGIASMGTATLAGEYGIGPAKAARLAAALELGQRVFQQAIEQPRLMLVSVDDVLRWARPRLGTLEHEEVWLLCLDGQNGLKAARRVAQGGLHGCALTPRDVLRPAVRAARSSAGSSQSSE